MSLNQPLEGAEVPGEFITIKVDNVGEGTLSTLIISVLIVIFLRGIFND